MERKATANDLTHFLVGQGVKCQSIHGDRVQVEREKALNDFKRSFIRILIATDVAARGLDIPNVAYVIIFDLPTNIDSYVHRIGRTGRIGNTGMAISLIDERPNAVHKELLELLEECKQEVPDWFRKLASGNQDMAPDSFSKPSYSRGRGNNSWNDRGGYNSYNKDEASRDEGRGFPDNSYGGRGNSYNNYNSGGYSGRDRGGRGRGYNDSYGANESYGGRGGYNSYGGGYSSNEGYAKEGYAANDAYAPREGYAPRNAYPPRQDYNSKPESQGWQGYESKPDTGYQKKEYGGQNNEYPRGGRYNNRRGNNSGYGNSRGNYSNWNSEEPADYKSPSSYSGSYVQDSSAPSIAPAPPLSHGYGANSAAKYPSPPNPAYPPSYGGNSYNADRQGYNNAPAWSAFPVVEEPKSYYPPAPQSFDAPASRIVPNSNDKPIEDDPWAEA